MGLLEYVYDELAKMSWNFSYKEFSEKYLGRSGGYYSYLSSTGNPPSADAILNLWRELIKEREKYSFLSIQSTSVQEQEIFCHMISVYKRLANEVFSSLEKQDSA